MMQHMTDQRSSPDSETPLMDRQARAQYIWAILKSYMLDECSLDCASVGNADAIIALRASTAAAQPVATISDTQLSEGIKWIDWDGALNTHDEMVQLRKACEQMFGLRLSADCPDTMAEEICKIVSDCKDWKLIGAEGARAIYSAVVKYAAALPPAQPDGVREALEEARALIAAYDGAMACQSKDASDAKLMVMANYGDLCASALRALIATLSRPAKSEKTLREEVVSKIAMSTLDVCAPGLSEIIKRGIARSIAMKVVHQLDDIVAAGQYYEGLLREIGEIVRTPTKATRHRSAQDHFQADFDAIRKIVAVGLTRPVGGAKHDWHRTGD